jgi:hypothetical protein
MNERWGSLGFGLLALVPIACCVGIPLVAAAGISVAAAAWAGGIAVGAVVLVAVVTLLALRLRQRRHFRQAPPFSVTRSRS